MGVLVAGVSSLENDSKPHKNTEKRFKDNSGNKLKNEDKVKGDNANGRFAQNIKNKKTGNEKGDNTTAERLNEGSVQGSQSKEDVQKVKGGNRFAQVEDNINTKKAAPSKDNFKSSSTKLAESESNTNEKGRFAKAKPVENKNRFKNGS